MTNTQPFVYWYIHWMKTLNVRLIFPDFNELFILYKLMKKYKTLKDTSFLNERVFVKNG